ncbi:MAG TPA: pseudouridine synthase [Beijerinckiaceae bacterium]|jgi:23S rRNA pseudouridine2605 synthase
MPVERVEATEERIAKVMARAGVASRRDAEVLIEQGRVTLNGATVTSPALNVTASDRIAVDGEPLPEKERTRLWLYHKPRGLVTTARDPQGRPTVFEQLPEDLPRVVTVGRLDINTEGLLLLTNDGGLAKVVAHPDTGWLRRYKVRAHGAITQDRLDALRGGITIDEVSYGPVEARIDREQGDNLWITIGLREGKNREIKRILEHLGLQVNRLIRLSFGPFQLGDIEPGQVEEVRTKVLREQLGATLAAQAGVDFEGPVREPIAPFGKPSGARDAEPARERGPRREERGPRRDESGRSDRERPTGRREERGPRREERGPGRDGRGPDRETAARKEMPRGAARRSVWRDEDATPDTPRGRKIPRRGLDPKEAREKVAGRVRERVGAIETGERKVVVERLKAEPRPERPSRGRRADASAGEERPRRSGPPAGRPPRSDHGTEDRPRRASGPFEGRREARFEPRTDAGDRPRRDRAEAPGGRPPRADRAPRQDAPPRARFDRGPPRERGAGPGRGEDRRSEGRPESGFGRGSSRGPGSGPGRPPSKGPGGGSGRGPGSGPRGGTGKGPPRGKSPPRGRDR